MRTHLLAAVILAAGVVAGCQSGSGGARGGVRLTVEPGFELASVEVVGFLGIGMSVDDDQARSILEGVMEDHLMATQHPFVLLSMREIQSRARREGALEAYRDVVGFWQDRKKVDKFQLAALAEVVGIDAILVGNLDDWTESHAPAGSDEPSYTRVSVSLELYPVESGRRAWWARKSVMAEAQQLARVGVGEGYSDPAAGFGTRSGSMPPRFEEVIPDLAAALAAALDS